MSSRLTRVGWGAGAVVPSPSGVSASVAQVGAVYPVAKHLVDDYYASATLRAVVYFTPSTEKRCRAPPAFRSPRSAAVRPAHRGPLMPGLEREPAPLARPRHRRRMSSSPGQAGLNSSSKSVLACVAGPGRICAIGRRAYQVPRSVASLLRRQRGSGCPRPTRSSAALHGPEPDRHLREPAARHQVDGEARARCGIVTRRPPAGPDQVLGPGSGRYHHRARPDPDLPPDGQIGGHHSGRCPSRTKFALPERDWPPPRPRSAADRTKLASAARDVAAARRTRARRR